MTDRVKMIRPKYSDFPAMVKPEAVPVWEADGWQVCPVSGPVDDDEQGTKPTKAGKKGLKK